MSDSATPWAVACQASLSITNFQSLLKPMSIKSVMPSNHLIQPSHPTNLISSTISSHHVIPFFSYLQSFPASGAFLMSQFLTSGGQSTEASASASASVLPVNIQDWFRLELTGLITWLSKWIANSDNSGQRSPWGLNNWTWLNKFYHIYRDTVSSEALA